MQSTQTLSRCMQRRRRRLFLHCVSPHYPRGTGGKKTQTGATFIALLHQIESLLKATKRALDLPVYAPSIVLMDWADDSRDDSSSHADDGCDQFDLYVSHRTDTC